MPSLTQIVLKLTKMAEENKQIDNKSLVALVENLIKSELLQEGHI